MDDTISRNAAIDSLEEPCKVSDTWTDEYAVGERMQWEKDVKALNSLPSAQPDIIRCKDCKLRDADGWCSRLRWVGFNGEPVKWKPNEMGYCHTAERRSVELCQNCGADMNGKEESESFKTAKIGDEIVKGLKEGARS